MFDVLQHLFRFNLKMQNFEFNSEGSLMQIQHCLAIIAMLFRFIKLKKWRSSLKK